MTERELADILERFGINDLANEVRDAPVSIDNERDFTVWDKEREGYGVSYHISNEITDRGEPVMAVYHKLEEPEGGTEWGWGGPFYYDYPEGKDFYPEDVDLDSNEEDEIEYEENDRANDEWFFSGERAENEDIGDSNIKDDPAVEHSDYADKGDFFTDREENEVDLPIDEETEMDQDIEENDDDERDEAADDWGDEDLDEGLEISDAVAEDREYDEKFFSGDPAENVDIEDDDEWDDAIEPTGD